MQPKPSREEPPTDVAHAALALELAADVGHIGLWRHDLRANRLHYNERAWALLQMQPRAQGLSLDEVRALIHPDDLPVVAATAERALTAIGPVDMQARYRRADGQWRHILTRRVVQRNRNGEAIAFVGVALDVTEQVSATQRSIELARRLETTAAALRMGLWSQDAETGDSRWNGQMWAIYGLPEASKPPSMEEWLRRCVHPGDRQRVRDTSLAWVRGTAPTMQLEYRVVHPDGATRWVSVSASREGRDARQQQVFGIALDVTERRTTEAALLRANERVALAARALGIGIWELELASGRRHWDEQMFRLRGLEPAAEAPGEAARLALIHPDDREPMRRLIDVCERRLEPQSFEMRVRLPDGRYRWLAGRTTPVFDSDGTPASVLGVNWDVTDSVSARQALQDKEIAERESHAKSQFLARMSHELRTPLNAVLGFTQLLAAELRDAPARDKLEHVRAAGEHLLSLINDALDLSRLESDQLPLQPEAVTLADLASEVVAMVEPLAREHGVAIEAQAVGGVAWADRIRLRQVVINLMTNAIKYNRAGGRVVIEATPAGERVEVRVSDTGRGMTSAQLARVFEPFNRLGAEGSGIEGTGIGLAIAKGLVERMGGRIEVRSEAGVGSLFVIELPAATKAPQADAAAARRAQRRRPRAPVPRRNAMAACSTSRTTRSIACWSRS